MITIDNTQECFVELWLRLERTRQLLQGQYKRYCIRNVLRSWFGLRADDDFIWEVCHLCGQEGWNELPSPLLSTRKPRELLRAIVAVNLNIGMRRVKYKTLDAAYTIAFPGCTLLNIGKKKRQKPP